MAGSDRWSTLEDVDRSLVSSFLFSALKREKCSWFLGPPAATSRINPLLGRYRMINPVPPPQPVDMSRGCEAETRSDWSHFYEHDPHESPKSRFSSLARRPAGMDPSPAPGPYRADQQAGPRSSITSMEDVWADLVIAILSVNRYSLERTFVHASALREGEVFDPDKLGV